MSLRLLYALSLCHPPLYTRPPPLAVVDPFEMKRQAVNLAYAFVGLGVGMLIVVTAQKHSFNVIGERLTMQVYSNRDKTVCFTVACMLDTGPYLFIVRESWGVSRSDRGSSAMFHDFYFFNLDQ